MPARQVINVGTVANDGTGDTIRAAFQKANTNFFSSMPLEANLNIYVDPTGNDANDGLTLASPKLTIQAGVSAAASYIPGYVSSSLSYTVTVNVANGTYSSADPVVLPAGFSGIGRYTLLGNASSPGSVILRHTGTTNRTLDCQGRWNVNGFRLEYTGATAGTNLLRATANNSVEASNIVYGTNVATGVNVYASSGGRVNLLGTQADIGGRTIGYFFSVDTKGEINVASITVACGVLTVTDTVLTNTLGFFNTVGVTFTGTVTGRRYNAIGNSVINTFGGGANYFPGNTAGATATGGQYL
jgi:hypothetical protein